MKRDMVIKEIMELEINCIVSCVIFICSIVFDAVSSLDIVESNDTAPTSMRTSSVILIACLASPPIRQRQVFLQRLILGSLLAVCSFVGNHSAIKELRIADCIFTFFISVATLSSYMRGGVDSLSSSRKKSMTSEAPEFTVRESVCALAIATLFYSSCRVVRQGVSYSTNVLRFSVTSTSWDGVDSKVPGYAHMNVASVLSLVFGGVSGCLLSAILLSSTQLREIGTGSKREIMLIGGFLQFASAFWATVAISEQQENLGALFSGSACATEVCPASGIGRRFAMLNGNPTMLWMNSFGTFVLAYGPFNTNDKELGKLLVSPIVVVWGVLSTVACVAIIFAYASFQGSGIYVEIASLIALAGIAIASFWNTNLGSIVFCVGILYDEYVSVTNHSLITILTYLTHCSIFVGVVALALRTVVSMIVELTWSFIGSKITDVLDDIVGVLTIAGTSIFTFLYFATAALLASYDGLLLGPSNYEEGPKKYARSLVAAVLEHWLPILVFLPLYRTKQVSNVSFWYKFSIWIGTFVLTLAVWVTALLIAGRNATHMDAYSWSSQIPFVTSILLACIVPWLIMSVI